MAEGHRSRVRTRSNEQSPETIPEYEVLEMIIHGVVKQKDVGAAARALIKEFGSLAHVIDAPARELCKIEGIGPASADFINKIPYFYKKYMQSKWDSHKTFDNPDDVMQYLSDRFIGCRTETVIVMCLDPKCKLLACKEVFRGSINSVDISIRRIIDFAIATNAARVIIAHNHPDGTLEPSHSDQRITRQIYNALNFANILLDDHVIITDTHCISLAQEGFIPHLRDDKNNEV